MMVKLSRHAEDMTVHLDYHAENIYRKGGDYVLKQIMDGIAFAIALIVLVIVGMMMC